MDDSQVSYNQIPLAFDRGQIAVVVELCKKRLRNLPNDGFVWLWYGMAQTELARYAEAEKAIRRAIKLCPQALPNAYVQMGHIFKAKGEPKRAVLWYRKALKHKPNDASYHIYLGSNAFNQGLLGQAEAHYRRALKCSEGSLDEAHFNLGGVLLARRNYPEAVKCYQEALKIDPKYKIAKKRLEDAKLALLMLEP